MSPASVDMKHEGWKQIWDLYQQASALPREMRAAFLDGLSAPDERERVSALLAEEESLTDAALDESDPAEPEVWPPERIGVYRLIELIGEGGMGAVYRAEQEGPLRRTVALKLIRSGLQNRESLARFELERQALARMEHPHIARAFDAGAGPNGRPYFVMEYVPGLPFVRYCEGRNLPIRRRLELFIPVCEAIQHAHQRGIIHRDIKPSNVLVVERDGAPSPKVIDFGVAKATEHEEGLTMTQAGAVVGTFDYMSPEQAVGGVLEVDTRSDIYSLGMLLYQALTGVTPRGEPVEPPSRRVAEPFAADLDWIVLKAIERDRDLRYQSAGALAQDIQRYLNGEIVEAGPPSRVYRLRKFARRYRVWLATAAAFVLVLMVATAVSIRQARRADQEAAVAKSISDFLMTDLLRQASPRDQGRFTPDPNLTVREALRRASLKVKDRFGGQPLLAAELEKTIARAYLFLGLTADAQLHFEGALAALARVRGASLAEKLVLERELAQVMVAQERLEPAEAILRRVTAEHSKLLGDRHPETLMTRQALARAVQHRGRYEEAEALYRQVLQGRTAVLGERHQETLQTSNSLGHNYFFLKRYEEAERIHARTLAIRREVLGPGHFDTLVSMQNLARAYISLGRLPQAETMMRETYAMQARTVGPEDEQSLATLNNLGFAILEQGRFAEAARMFEELVPRYQRVMGKTNSSTLNTVGNLAAAYARMGQWRRAREIFDSAIGLSRQTHGDAHPATKSLLKDREQELARAPQ